MCHNSNHYQSTVFFKTYVNFGRGVLCLFVQKGRAALFLLGVNISYGIPFIVFCERLFFILIHFSLTKICFHTLSISATPVFQQIID